MLEAPEASAASLMPIPYTLVETRHGRMLVNPNDIYMGQAYLNYGECSEIETQFLLSLLQAPGVVIEVGANMGVHTAPMARALGRRRLLALEPQRVIFQQLCANLALNGLDNVTALPYAAGAAPGVAAIELPDYRRPGNFGAASLEAAAGGATEWVQQAPLDALVGEERVGLIKVDVEGAEIDVLRGAAHILRRDRPVLYVENDRVERSAALIRWLWQKEYRLWWHLPPLYNPHNLRGVAENRYPEICSVNMLCLPRGSSMTAEGDEIVDESWHPTMR